WKLPWQRKHPHLQVVFSLMHWNLDGQDTLTPENATKFIDFYRTPQMDWHASAARFYNLGNAHFLADQLPEAILAYRRGLHLDPNDNGLADNLDYVRARVQNPFGNHGQPEQDGWPQWLYRPSSLQALAVALILYSATCLLATRWFMTRRRALLVRACIVF